MEHWTTEMQAEIARHNHAWGPGLFDFKQYLEVSSGRFYLPYCALVELGPEKKVCDVGSHWGVWPLTLRELGHDVAMTEAMQYYGDSFRALFDFIESRGVRIYDFDPFESEASLPEKFDLVTVMAVLEHYPHSLRTFMDNAQELMADGGRIYIEVPNIAYLPKRIRFLTGKSPLVPLVDIYESETPFIGHHHEFTMAELRELVRWSGLSVVREHFFNYSPGPKTRIKTLVRRSADVLFAAFKEGREILAVECERSK